MAARFIRNGTWLTPTLSIIHGLGGEYLREREVVGRLHRFGMQLLAGTDGNASVVSLLGGSCPEPHCAVQYELELLVEAGLTPLEALQAATLNPAKFLNATDSLGTVAPGKLADLVLLDADPLVNVTNTTAIRAVVANGRYFDRAALDNLPAEAQPKQDP